MSKQDRSPGKSSIGKLCEVKRFQLDQIRPLVDKPKYVCKKCCRVATKRKHLCNPVSLD